jgi:hypothetical protein
VWAYEIATVIQAGGQKEKWNHVQRGHCELDVQDLKITELVTMEGGERKHEGRHVNDVSLAQEMECRHDEIVVVLSF